MDDVTQVLTSPFLPEGGSIADNFQEPVAQPVVSELAKKYKATRVPAQQLPNNPAIPPSTGMGYERKKPNFPNMLLSSTIATSSFNYRTNDSPTIHPLRSPSPPASAYFTLSSSDAGTRFTARPNAESHFAYSTTLRRRETENANWNIYNLWKSLRMDKGAQEEDG